MSRFFQFNCFDLSHKELKKVEAVMDRMKLEEYFGGETWKGGTMNADLLYDLAVEYFDGDKDKADDLRAEVMEWRMKNKLDPLTGEPQ